MEIDRMISRFAGVLIFAGIIVGVVSVVPSVEGVEYLTDVFPNRYQVLIGALCQFLLVPIYIGFALLLYGSVKQQSESFALGFVGFRFVAGAFQLVGVILLPVFIALSKGYLNLEDGAEGEAYFEQLGSLLKLVRDLSNHLGVMVATGIGNLFLYSVFIRGRYISKWLSVWGILGNSLLIIASILLLFGSIEVISTAYISMTIPLVLQEIVLAVWLVTKGLNLGKSINK